jgi:CheY-like chemotaxis protein
MALSFLLADDDFDDMELFREALTEVDTSVASYCVTSGRKVLEKLNSVQDALPDMIFLDINMPEMNGWECLVKLKDTDSYKHIPVIMYSTSSQKTVAAIAKDLGALCFFTKPNDFSHLKKILEVVVSHMHSSSVDAICDAIGDLETRLN